MSILTINTPFNIELEFSLAAFHKRLFAWVVDLGIIMSYSCIMRFFIYQNLPEPSFDGQNVWVLYLELFTIALPAMLYHFLFELLMNGRSPGKALVRIKVVNKEGGAAGMSQLLLRWIIFLPTYVILSIAYLQNPFMLVAIAFSLGIAAIPDVLSIALSKMNQRMGDLAAGTIVVDARYKMDIAETIYMAVEDDGYRPLYPQVLRLSDKDINGIRNLLSAKKNNDTENYMYRVAYRIEEVLQIKMQGDPYTFLQTLLKDYNYLTQRKAP
ncbi:MAG: RDD family protein [Edaphocola sp.]